jgi:hypothetical protein
LSGCHSCKSGGYLPVELSGEFHHDGFGIGISRVIYQVAELVQVVIYHSFALEVGQSLQYIYGCGFCIEGHEVFVKLILKIDPVGEAEPPILGSGLVLEISCGPVTSLSGLHVRHCPDNFDGVIVKGLQA